MALNIIGIPLIPRIALAPKPEILHNFRSEVMLGSFPSLRVLSRTLSARSLSSQLQLPTRIRFYASKSKGKSPVSNHSSNVKDSHASTTKNLIPASERAFLDDDIQAEYENVLSKMTSTVEWIRKEVAGIVARGVGRVSTSVLDGVRVALSDEQSQKKEARLNEIATVGIRDGNCIIVTLHDDNYFKPTEKAIYAAKIPSVVPQKVDARTLKIVIPRPTIEARAELLQVAAKKAEEARVQLRKAKDTVVRKYKWRPKSSEAEQFQKLCDLRLKDVDNILQKAKQEFAK